VEILLIPVSPDSGSLRSVGQMRLFGLVLLCAAAVTAGPTSAAELTTVGGHTFLFDPGNVTMVEIKSLAQGEELIRPNHSGSATWVYGITPRPLPISETIPEFLGRLNLTEDFAMFTLRNGAETWVKCSAVAYLRAPIPGDGAPPNVKSYIGIGLTERGVTQDVETAKKVIDDHKGKL
jgi:hypothetical protein